MPLFLCPSGHGRRNAPEAPQRSEDSKKRYGVSRDNPLPCQAFFLQICRDAVASGRRQKAAKASLYTDEPARRKSTPTTNMMAITAIQPANQHPTPASNKAHPTQSKYAAIYTSSPGLVSHWRIIVYALMVARITP